MAQGNLAMWDRVRAGILLEAELRNQRGDILPDIELPDSVRFVREMPVLNRLFHVRSWLHYVNPAAEDVLPVCDALVGHIVAFRDDKLRVFEQRREFLVWVREIWPEIQRIALTRIDSASAAENPVKSTEHTLSLITWAEQFENRLLIDRILVLQGRLGRSAANETNDLRIRRSWPFLHVQPRPNGMVIPPTPSVGVLSTALGVQELPQPDAGALPGQISDEESAQVAMIQQRCRQFARIAAGPADLRHLVPESVVVIRTLFDASSALRWWAIRRNRESVSIFACGRSSLPGTRERLIQATTLFDRTVEGIWKEYRESSLIDRSDGRQGLTRRDLLRRQRLNDTSADLLAAVEGEFDLEPLWRASQAAKIDWGSTDVIFQIQGPLWAAPLGWLDLGGQHLFDRAASVTTVVSLTARALAEADAKIYGAPCHRILSAHWLEESEWRQTKALADLHGYLLDVGARHGWEVWGLGDVPEASIMNLQFALSRREDYFGMLVLGGHGSVDGAGVRMAGRQVWQGQGDLHRLDWIVLVACAVGRLRQEGQRDVEGLIAQLVAHGGRCALAARWPIADIEAAAFTAAVVSEYLTLIQNKTEFCPFARARAVNRARRLLQSSPKTAFPVSFHVASSFEVYGLG